MLGSDGKALFGDSPWRFEPHEGTTENKGLALQYQQRDIATSGRETLKLTVHRLAALGEGNPETVGSWRRDSWRIDMARVGR